jgi:putative hydrolase of the HAD superfamily
MKPVIQDYNYHTMIKWIAFDADDTLWHNETLYTAVQDRFKDLLARYRSREWIENVLYETEMRNLQHFGYGIKAFTLSMIETAIELTEGRIEGREIRQIIEFGKGMLQAEIQVLEGVEEALAQLSKTYDLMIITKGDLLDQELKISRSGLAHYFRVVEVVSSKTRESYAAILAKRQIRPEEFVMIGNSLKSDILPVLELGAKAVFIPYSLTWAHEHVTEPVPGTNGFHKVELIRSLPELIAELDRQDEAPPRSDHTVSL